MEEDEILGAIRWRMQALRIAGLNPVTIELGRRQYGQVLRAWHRSERGLPPDPDRLTELWGVPVRLVDDDFALRVISD